MRVGSSFWRRVVLFLFVCFSTPKVGDYFVFKSHKWVRFSCFVFVCVWGGWVCVCVCVWGGCVCVCVCVCFVLFFLQNVQFPHHISRVRLIFFFFFFFVSPVGKVFCFLLFLFVCFYLILFCFVFCSVLPKIPPPLDIKWCALILILLHR